MHRFTFVGDLHLDSRTPSSRVDDYPAATISKLLMIGDVAKDFHSTHIFFAGDIFHRKSQTVEYLARVIQTFSKLSDSFKLYSIVGNHDLQHDRIDTLSSNPFYLLQETGFLNRLEEVYLEDEGSCGVLIRGVDFTSKIGDNPVPDDAGKRDITFLIGHRFFENSMDEDPLLADVAIDLGWDFYLLGHDHVPYPDVRLSNGSFVLRPGSLTRGTSHDYQLERDVQVINFEVSDEGLTYFEFVSLPVSMGEDVFSHQVFSKESSVQNIRSRVAEGVEKMVAIMGEKSGGGSIFSFIDEISVDPSLRSNLDRVLAQQGIFRTPSEYLSL